MSYRFICCTLWQDLLIEAEILTKEERFDFLLVECTSIVEPIKVTQTFSFNVDDIGIDITQIRYIDSKLYY